MKPLGDWNFDPSRRIYFLGIGGVGMSGLARVFRHRGFEVAGSDRLTSPWVSELKSEEIPVHVGEDAVFLKEDDQVIYSSAIRPSHLELAWAREKKLPLIHRAQALAYLMNGAETAIAITGTHGKTTTSAMISFVLAEAHFHPTCVVGGKLVNRGSNVILGGDDFFVSEVDESDGSQKYYSPHYAILTNLEEEHMDHYVDLKGLKQSMRAFLAQLHDPGLVVYSEADPLLRELVPASGRPRLSFGLTPEANVYADRIRLEGLYSRFDVLQDGFFLGHVVLSVPGLHNILNALGALALLLQLGVDLDVILDALFRFRGTRRRIEVKLDLGSTMVVDDYAHHPAEVRATLGTLSQLERPLTVIFQPHRFSRTQYLGSQFGRAFQEADELILTDIYGAGEENPKQVTSQLIYNAVCQAGHASVKMLPKDAVIDHLLARNSLEGIFAFLGAGDIGEVADEFARRIQKAHVQNTTSV